jgi:signal transduction histidine kinase
MTQTQWIHAVLLSELGQDLPAVRANAARLRQIVLNLVTNASEAIGDRDGTIQVTTSCVNLNQDSAAFSDHVAEGDHIQLEVSDTGLGIDPFFTTKPQGHGLGLAVVDGIVRDLQGTIRFASEPGIGTSSLCRKYG